MPDQSEHEKVENLVESVHPKVHTATSIEDEVNSNNTMEGYAAMNHLANQDIGKEIKSRDENFEAEHQDSNKAK